MIIKNKPITIIRSAIGSLASVGFIKFLKSCGFEVIGTDITGESAGKFFVDAFYKVPKASDGLKVVESYLSIAKKEKAKWIISGPEDEIIVLSRHKSVFEHEGIYILHPDYELLKVITDKYNAYNYLRKKGITLPSTDLLVNFNDYRSQSKFVIKPRKGRGSSGVIICDKTDELHWWYKHLIKPE